MYIYLLSSTVYTLFVVLTFFKQYWIETVKQQWEKALSWWICDTEFPLIRHSLSVKTEWITLTCPPVLILWKLLHVEAAEKAQQPHVPGFGPHDRQNVIHARLG